MSQIGPAAQFQCALLQKFDSFAKFSVISLYVV